MPENATPAGWSLDSQLKRDTVEIGDLPLCRALLIDDANYPWMLLVPRRRGIVEIFELDDADQSLLIGEIALASNAIKWVTGCDKVNVAALGNVVAQLHVHVIARSHSDAAWPKPAWGAAPPRAYDEAAMRSLLSKLRQRLGLAP